MTEKQTGRQAQEKQRVSDAFGLRYYGLCFLECSACCIPFVPLSNWKPHVHPARDDGGRPHSRRLLCLSDIFSRVPENVETGYQILRVPNSTRCLYVTLVPLVLGVRPHDLIPTVNAFWCPISSFWNPTKFAGCFCVWIPGLSRSSHFH